MTLSCSYSAKRGRKHGRVTREEDLSSDQTNPPAGQVPFIYPTRNFYFLSTIAKVQTGEQARAGGGQHKRHCRGETRQYNWTTWVWDGQQERGMAMAWSESHFAMQPWRPRSRAGAVAGVIHRKGPSPSHPQGYELVAPQMSLGDQSKRRYHGILTPRAHGQAFLAAGVAIQLVNPAPRVPNSHVRASPSWVLIFLLSSWMKKRNRSWGNGKRTCAMQI